MKERNINKGGFRALSNEEIKAVSGGASQVLLVILKTQ